MQVYLSNVNCSITKYQFFNARSTKPLIPVIWSKTVDLTRPVWDQNIGLGLGLAGLLLCCKIRSCHAHCHSDLVRWGPAWPCKQAPPHMEEIDHRCWSNGMEKLGSSCLYLLPSFKVTKGYQIWQGSLGYMWCDFRLKDTATFEVIFIVSLFCGWNITAVEINSGVKSTKCLYLLPVVLVLVTAGLCSTDDHRTVSINKPMWFTNAGELFDLDY